MTTVNREPPDWAKESDEAMSRWHNQLDVWAEDARRNAARRKFHYAVRHGKLKRGDTCERCGFKSSNPREIHGHHYDYNKPLEVEWLCRPCHHKHHNTLRVGWRAER